MIATRRYTAHLFATCLGIFAGSGIAQAATQLSLPDLPLIQKNAVENNVLVTLDDSGSMAWGFMPDSASEAANLLVSRTCQYYWWDFAKLFPYNCRDEGAFRYASSDYNGMYYDPDVRYTAPVNELGIAYSTSFTAAYRDGFRTSAGTVDLSRNFKPTDEFIPGGTESFATYLPKEAAYYYQLVPSRSGCSTATRPANSCFDKFTVPSSQYQNFANWYSFYRTRVLATRSAASLGMSALGSNVRLGFQNLHTCDGFDTACKDVNGTTYDSRIRSFTGAKRKAFYDWVKNAPASGGTPLRTALVRAGNYIKQTGVESPYASNPGSSEQPLLACRSTFHVAMTDGIWNSDSISVGNVDNTAATTPGGCSGATCPNYIATYGPTAYTARAPFTDGTGSTVADIVFQQWITDAQPNIPNRVPPVFDAPRATRGPAEYWDPANDPAEWQHMRTYLVALGLAGLMRSPYYDGTMTGGDYGALLAGTKTWPAAGSNKSPENSYDLWHAAMNGRGKFYGPKDPNQLVDAFRDFAYKAQTSTGSGTGATIDSGITRNARFAFNAVYNTAGWSGDLKAYTIDPATLRLSATPAWSLAANLQRDYGSKPSNVANRNIKFKATDGTMKDFIWANLSTAQRDSLNISQTGTVDTLGPDRLNYVRGDTSRAIPLGPFRSRATPLGDVINSAPTFVGAPSRVGYDDLEPGAVGNPYSNYQRDNRNRAGRIYFGANDGMLHAVDATNGNETFAYLPADVIPNLRFLTYENYNHRFYVDGPLAAGDVYDGTRWRTILVGSNGLGGKTVFALDVTDPNNTFLLWEFTSNNDADLGHLYTRPAIVRLHNNKWGVLIGNGYNSANNKAVLFVRDAITGADIKKFEAGTANTSIPNGLAAPSAMDINGDLVTDYVYAGDLRGNVWRFDLVDTSKGSDAITGGAQRAQNNASPTTWKIGYGGSPLFVAKDAAGNIQPITANLTFAPHPTGTGALVMFGTGKFLESADTTPDVTKYQTFYGVWDRYVFGEATTSAMVNNVITRSKMQQQRLSTATNRSFDGEQETVREVTGNSVQWFETGTSTVKNHGWYLDLVEYSGSTPNYKGEMVVTNSAVLGNAVLFSSNTVTADECSASLDRWIVALRTATGGKFSLSAFDFNKDGKIDTKDGTITDTSSPAYSSFKSVGIGAPTVLGENVYINEVTPLDQKIEVKTVLVPNNNTRRSWQLMR